MEETPGDAAPAETSTAATPGTSAVLEFGATWASICWLIPGKEEYDKHMESTIVLGVI